MLVLRFCSFCTWLSCDFRGLSESNCLYHYIIGGHNQEGRNISLRTRVIDGYGMDTIGALYMETNSLPTERLLGLFTLIASGFHIPLEISSVRVGSALHPRD